MLLFSKWSESFHLLKWSHLRLYTGGQQETTQHLHISLSISKGNMDQFVFRALLIRSPEPHRTESLADVNVGHLGATCDPGYSGVFDDWSRWLVPFQGSTVLMLCGAIQLPQMNRHSSIVSMWLCGIFTKQKLLFMSSAPIEAPLP